MKRKKKRAPGVQAHLTGAKKKHICRYDSTVFRKMQAIKMRRREMIAEMAALPAMLAVFTVLFWLMWTLKGVG